MKKMLAALALALLAPACALGDSEGVIVQSSCNIVQSGDYYLAYCFAQVHNNASTVICLDRGTFDLQSGETLLSTSEISQIWPYFLSPGEDGYLFDIVSFEPDENGNPVIPSITGISYNVTYLPVDADGFVTVQQVENALRPDTVLVSVMAANNEIGTLEPVAEIGALCHERGVLFHTDAVQAVGAIPLDVEALHADMLSLSAHKFHGPKGIGALYIRKGVKIDPLIHGGAQERGHRAGTENLPGIVGLGKAIELAEEGLAENAARMTFLRNRLVSGLTAAIPDMRINGTMEKRLPNNVNVSFAGIEGEAVLLRLDLEGIAASSGSACTAGSLDPSHVLTAIGLTRDEAKGSLRLTLGTDTTQADVDEVVKKLPGIVASLREMTSWCGRG